MSTFFLVNKVHYFIATLLKNSELVSEVAIYTHLLASRFWFWFWSEFPAPVHLSLQLLLVPL